MKTLQEAIARAWRKRLLRHREGKNGQSSRDIGKPAPAFGARIEMTLHRCIFRRRKQAHRVEREVFFGNVIAVSQACNAFRIEIKARRMRVFTVPSGSPVFSAISE